MPDRALVVALTALALLLHLIAFAGSGPRKLGGDSDDYLTAARALAERGAMLDESGAPETRHGPGYVALLAAVLALGGGTAAAALLNHLFAVACVPLTFATAMASGLSRAFAAMAALVVAVHPDVTYWSNMVLSEPLFTLLLLASLLLAIRGRIAAASLVLGAAIVTRPAGLLLPFAAAAVALVARRPRAAATALLCAAILPAAWIVRNRIETGAAMLTSTGGEMLYLDRAAGAVAMHDDGFALSLLPSAREDAKRRYFFGVVQPRLGPIATATARQRYGAEPTPMQRASVQTELGRALIARYPLAFAESTLHAFAHMLGDPPFDPPLAGAAFSVALALLAIAGTLAAHPLAGAAFWTLAAVSSGPGAAYYSRFRYPLIPLMAILAAAAAERIWRGVRHHAG